MGLTMSSSSNNPPPQKFDAAFIERRMAEHRALQQQHALDLESAIVTEVYISIVRKIEAQEKEGWVV